MKKIIAILAVMALVVACFAACGGKTTTEDKATGSDAPTTAAIVENPGETSADALVMGTNAAFPPYEFVGDDGEYAGIDVEIANAVAEKLGKTLEVQNMDFKALIPAVSQGKVDVVLAGMTVTEERQESVNFSDSYATGVQVVIVTEDSPIASVDDLSKETTFGVQAGTTGDIYVTDDYGMKDENETVTNVKQYDNGSLAVQALLNGQVDCVVIDNEPAKNFVEANEGLKILETEYVVEDYAAAFAKENTELLDQFNNALSELKADGTIDAIIAKYIPAK